MEGKFKKSEKVKRVLFYNNNRRKEVKNRRKIIRNNSIQLFIIYAPNQQLQGQLQTENSVDTSNYIMDKHNIKSKTNYRKVLEEKHIYAEK
jgi:hypothetical protein